MHGQIGSSFRIASKGRGFFFLFFGARSAGRLVYKGHGSRSQGRRDLLIPKRPAVSVSDTFLSHEPPLRRQCTRTASVSGRVRGRSTSGIDTSA
jgi:hypothetical protein